MSRAIPLSAHLVGAICAAALALPNAGWAGNVFVTGHDPDFHALDGGGAVNLLRVALDFVTCGTASSPTEKFLVISARPADLGGVPAGHRDPITAGFNQIGLIEGVHFDVANAAAVPTADFSRYTALAVVSAFGGLLTRAELDALVARRADVIDFLSAGGGVFASSECDSFSGIACGFNLLDPAPAPMFGFLPFPLSSVASAAPFRVTPEGAALGLGDPDVNDATHNSFQDAAGLTVIDVDSRGLPTTLAGRWVVDPVYPLFDTAVALDPWGCGNGLLVTWEAATWEEPVLGGVYHVYRSEGPAPSCADALARPPVASDLGGLSWFDRSTLPGIDYVYVVEAEDAAPPHGCDPPGPAGGAVAWACTEPAIMDEVGVDIPAGVFTTLFAVHAGHLVTLRWPAARPLLPGETYRLFKALHGPLEPFTLVNGTFDLSRSHFDLDTGAARQFFDLRVANACELLSADEYPPGW